jgi:hypothetical protein
MAENPGYEHMAMTMQYVPSAPRLSWLVLQTGSRNPRISGLPIITETGRGSVMCPCPRNLQLHGQARFEVKLFRAEGFP